MKRCVIVFLLTGLSNFVFCNDPASDIFQLAKLRQLDKAQLALDKVKSKSSTNSDGEIHFLQGVIHFELYQFKQALKELGEALVVLESLPTSEYLGHTYLYLARLYKDGFANSEHARFLLKKAMAVYNQLPNRELDIANVNFQMARSFPFSDLDKRTYFNGLAISFFESNPSAYAIELAECYNLNALILFYQDIKSEKWKYEFIKTIVLIKSRELSLQINLGKYYDNFGYCLSRTGNSEGLSYLTEGLTTNKKFKFNGYWVTSSLNNLSSHFERLGKPELSLKLYRDVVELRRKIFGENSLEVASGYEHIANTFRDLGKTDSALIYLNRSIDIYQNQSDGSDYLFSPYSLSYAFVLKRRAEVLQTEFQISRKRELLLLGIRDLLEGSRIIEENYSSFELESSKIAFLADVRSLFLKRIEIDQILFEETNEEQYAIDGLESMEFLRYASTFENQIRVRDSYSRPELKKLIARQLELKSELALLKSVNDGKNVREKILALSDQLFKVSDSIKAGVTFKQSQFAVRDILQDENQNESSLIEYQDSGDNFYIICIAQNQKKFIKVPKPEDWGKRLEEFYRSISQVPTLKTFDDDRMTFVRNSYFLYNTLLKPVENLIAPGSRLIIIPDGTINNLPFEALITSEENSTSYKDLEYLFRKYEIENSLSLRLNSTSQNEKKVIEKVLAFGFTEGPTSIPGADTELASIAKNFEVTARKGSESSSQYFMNEASGFPVIHLAIHGQADEANLLKSRLIFSEKDTLFSHQLYSMRLNSPLVVLSSCETAIGKAHSGEGIFSMARAFVLAGASSLIVTLWKTPDNSATVIFERFYELLSQGNNSSVSIQKAKLKYLDEADKINAHPYFWAGIRPVGNFPTKDNDNTVFMLISILSLSLCVFLLYKKFSM